MRFKELGEGAEMNCCGQAMFEGKDGHITVMVCTGGCEQNVRLECHCGTELMPCLAGATPSFFCLKCREEYYWKDGRLLKGSEALRTAQDAC